MCIDSKKVASTDLEPIRRNVSFKDVKYMRKWPLHPIHHLGGHIPDLVTYEYSAELLVALGISYNTLVSMHLTAEWMKMFKFHPGDWVKLGFDKPAARR
jgi:hypothetical protein